MKNISKYIEDDEILYEKTFQLNIGNMSFKVCRITDYDRAFINAVFSPEMLQDYFKHSYKCSHLQLSPGYNNVTRYKIFTDYDEILNDLNEKAKFICKYRHVKFKPYKLYIVKYQKEPNGVYKAYYHLHNSSNNNVLKEFYNTESLQNIFNELDEYINTLMPVNIIKNRALTTEDKKRKNFIDQEIKRTSDYLELLKKLKNT